MKSKFLTLLCSFLVLFSVNAHAFTLNDATSFDPISVQVQAANIGVPVGTVIVWTKEKIPEGWLECNGQAVPDMYPDLKALMPTVPNYQGMFLRGHGSQSFSQNNGTIIGITSTNYLSGNLGEIQGDSTRTHKGVIGSLDGPATYILGKSMAYVTGTAHNGGQQAGSQDTVVYYDFSRIFPTSNEIRPINIAVKYLIKAE